MKRNWKHPIAVLGLPLDSLAADAAVEVIEGLILSGEKHQVATANLDFWLNSLSDRHLHRIIAACSLVLADGMPLVWVSKLLGCPLADRVTGVDLVPKLADLSARKGYGIFLLGGNGNVAERAASMLTGKFPGLRVVGTYAPTKEELERQDQSELIERVHAARPEILFVALGNPKQEKWIWMQRQRLGVPVAMGVGGSFEIIVGDKRRAPQWVQNAGLEWAMRWLQEPLRLGPRYLRDLIGFGCRLPIALLGGWLQGSYSGRSHLTTVATAQAMHVHLHGKLSSEIADTLLEAADHCLAHRLAMVAHFEEVKQMNAAGLGALMQVRRKLLDRGLALSLAGLQLRHRLLLRSWFANPLFDEWGAPVSHGRSGVKGMETAARVDLHGEPNRLPAQTRARG